MPDPTTVDLNAWWALEDPSDSHDAYSLDLTPSGTINYVSGHVNNCADFGSGSAYLYHASAAGIQFGSTDPFSIIGWMNMVNRNYDYEVLGKWASGTLEWRIYYDYLPGKELKFGVSSNGSSETATAESNLSMQQGQWYFFHAYHDGAGTIGIEVDDGSSGSTGSGVTNSNGSQLWLGDTSAGAGNPLWGYLDEVAIFGRVLTAGEVTWLYNSGSGRTYTDLGDGSGAVRRFIDPRAHRRNRRIREPGAPRTPGEWLP